MFVIVSSKFESIDIHGESCRHGTDLLHSCTDRLHQRLQSIFLSVLAPTQIELHLPYLKPLKGVLVSIRRDSPSIHVDGARMNQASLSRRGMMMYHDKDD